MNDKIKDIFSSSGCPGPEVLLAYYRNRLTEEERHRVERHLVDCPMCSDELEGLSKMKDPEKLEEILEEIRAGVFEKKGKTVAIRWRFYAMAAAAIVVLAIGTLVTFRILTGNSGQNLPETANEMAVPKSEPQASPAGSRQPTAVPPPVAENKVKPQKNAGGVRSAELEVHEMAEEEPTPVAAADSISFRNKDTVKLAEPKPVAGVELNEQETPPVAGAVSKDEEAGKSDARQSKAAFSPDERLKPALDLFHSGRYSDARNAFGKILKSQPDNDKAAYYSAYCSYYLKEPEVASTMLKKILSDPASEYYPSATILLEKIKIEADSLEMKGK
ncbi:MAG TPA: zf-HC2 domain-containing protein [Bacteroidales bacterium]|nr:zf-HC2 domain-containing protein [Bacteroidales bacterium]